MIDEEHLPAAAAAAAAAAPPNSMTWHMLGGLDDDSGDSVARRVRDAFTAS